MPGYPTHDPARKPTPGTGLRLLELEDRTTPTLFGVGDVYNATAGQVLTVPSPVNAIGQTGIGFQSQTLGVLANDYSDAFPGSPLSVLQGTAAGVTTAFNGVIGVPRYVGSNQPLPANSVQLNQDGSFTFIAPPASQIPQGVTQVQFSYKAANLAGEVSNTTVVTINLRVANIHVIATGADAGGGPHVRVFESGSGLLRFNFFPYESTFTGGVRVAVGDLNNDGIDDIVTIPASGGAARVKAYDGRDGAVLVDQFVFNQDFRGGGYVAIGDFNGDGNKDIIVGAGEGGGPRVTVISLNPNSPTGTTTIADFFTTDPTQTTPSGVRVAAGDLRGIGRDFLVTAPGAGGGSIVQVFDGQQVLSRPIAFPVLQFNAGDATNTSGVFVSTGNFNSSGQADIITGTGSGPAIARVWDGRNGGLIREIAIPTDPLPTGGGTNSGPSTFSLATATSGSLLAPSVRPNALLPTSVGVQVNGVTTASGGARVATTDYNRDGIADIVVASGPGNAPRVRIFSGVDQTVLLDFLAYSPTFLGGVNVAAT